MLKMKRIWLFILSLFAIFLVWNFTLAKEYEYTNLNISANILNDGTIDIMENFTANFFVQKHWIIRDIPLNYSVEWQSFHIDISNVSVQWKKFTTSRNNWNIEIKIWDADRTLIWEQNYPIFYSTYGLIRNFSWMWYAELYWNLVGYDFDTNINKVKADIFLPKAYTWFSSDDFLITVDWSTKTVKEFKWTVDWRWWNKITITYDKWLPAYQGITLAIKFPNNYFDFNDDRQAKLIWSVSWSWILSFLDWFSLKIIAIIVWVFSIFGGAFNWLSKRNNWSYIHKSEIEDNLRKETPIVVRYTPPEWINCAEAGMLYNCKLEPTDLTSLIYKWIVEWLVSLRIEESVNFEKIDWFVMTKLKNIDWNHPSYEVAFFKYLLPWDINSKKAISKSSALEVSDLLKSLRSYGKSKWWIYVWFFSEYKKFIWILFGIVLFAVLFYIWIDIVYSVAWGFFIAALFDESWDSPTQKKIFLTDEWKKIALQVIWYAKFIQACDENKLRLFLKQDPTFFDRTLPYAVAFWFETSFIQKITPVLRELDVRPRRYSWDLYEMNSINSIVNTAIREQELRKQRERQATYDRSSWFSGGSWFSFWWFSRGWWGWWGWWRSW